MNRACLIAAVVAVFLVQSAARSQSQDLPKFEVAGEFTTLQREDVFGGKKTSVGFGGRFTYNLNRVFGVEAAGHFFPEDCFDCEDPGRATQVVGGVKVGKRFDKWGIFAKARPGVFHHSATWGGFVTCLSIGCPSPTGPFRPNYNHFAIDIGGVVEFYPSKRIVARIDAGDTIINFRRQTQDGIRFDLVTRQFVPFLFVLPGRTSHNFQFVTSVGFRF